MSKTEEMVPPGPGPEAAGPARIDERYRIDKEIGRGGMGRVFVAHDRKLGRDVAIKVLASGLHGEEALRRFEQEARATCALSHANILDVHDIGTHDGSPYIVSELLHGSTLRERLQQGALPPAEATGYALQLAKGLSAAHDKGIIHRDLKPENLFITNEGQLKILDFGIAKLLAPTASESAETAASPRPHTATGAIVGTVGYMSPEQVRGRPVDGRSDLFSFGAIFHEMLCGCSPFERDTAVETGYAVLSADPPELPAEVPAALKRIVQRCLEKEPARRFQSATDLVVALTATSGAPAEKSRWRWAAVVIVLVAVAAAGWFLWHESRIRWAREKVLPEIAQLVEQGRSRAAFALAEQIERIIPADPMLARLFKEMSVSLSIETSPDGADVFVADYDSSAFRHLGRAPVSVRLDDAFHRWRVTKDGFATVEAITSNGRVSGDIPFLSRKLKFVLDKELPAGCTGLFEVREVKEGLTLCNLSRLDDRMNVTTYLYSQVATRSPTRAATNGASCGRNRSPTGAGRDARLRRGGRAFSRSHGTSWTVDLDVRRPSRRSGRIPGDRRELVRSRGIRRVRGQVAAHRVPLEPRCRDVGERAHHSGEQFRRGGSGAGR